VTVAHPLSLLALSAVLLVSLIGQRIVYHRRLKRRTESAYASGVSDGMHKCAAALTNALKVSLDSGCDVDEIRRCLDGGQIPVRALPRLTRFARH